LPSLPLCLVLALLSTTLVTGFSSSLNATGYIQGVLATVTVNVFITTEYTEVPVLGNLLAIVNTSQGAYVSYRSGYLEVLSLIAPANITITYITELFKNVNGEYVAEFYNPYTVLTLYLPSNTLIIEVSNITHLRKTDERYELVFSEGEVRLVYIFVEVRASSIARLDWVWIALGVGATGGIGFIAYRLYAKRRREVEKLEALDERDRAIITALKSGPMTPQELIKITDMSKATFYRRIRRLVSMGYVEQFKKEGRVYYRLKKEESD